MGQSEEIAKAALFLASEDLCHGYRTVRRWWIGASLKMFWSNCRVGHDATLLAEQYPDLGMSQYS